MPWNSDQWRRDVTDNIWVRALRRKQLHPLLMRALRAAVATAVEIETQPFRAPATDPISTSLAVEQSARARAILAARDRLPQLWNEWRESMVAALTQIVAQAPEHDGTDPAAQPLRSFN